ncbi:zinc finger MYM-type protein 1-like [Zingiber officinale]|uniref:zinc finger MYM-type protein 1-like n=1 Tax=Zingiber officinale TaxID=94328 RepID=UPI001C4A8781|nr:zinc finger MYM-type protein 1-like [Zingiber officinale]
MGPYQLDMLEYLATKFGSQNHRFQKKWFQKFHWLEYSPSTNKAYCFYCFLFLNDINSSNISALVNEGFDNWKRVNQGKTYAFLAHIGSVASSPHTMCERRAENLMRPSQHIDNVIHVQAKEEKEKNRLCLRTSIVTVRWLALQGCAFRGNDESLSSSNRGNFLELVKAFAKMSTEIIEVVLENAPKNAPKNAQYIAPEIQKEILHIMTNRVRQMIRKEIGDKVFCILVDEAQDISKWEQMTIILRGQGYDGASNIRGAWNGLQALFLRDCLYAYYIHCFAHRLQLTLVSTTKDVSVIWEFFSHLDNIVNIVTSSTKRIAELRTAQRNEIEHMLAIGERDSGSGANQIGMYAATCKVFEVLSDYSPNARAKAKVRGIYRNMANFEFVFILDLMHKIMRTTDTLCQILQRKSQDILTAITFISTTKIILQKLRECGWEEFLHEVKVCCSRNEINVPDLDCQYTIGRSRQQTTVEHHYHFNVFNVAIDSILMELNTRFNESSMELLSLSTTLDPKNSFDSINNDDICKLAKKFYLEDFTCQDIVALEYELVHYKLDVVQNLKISTLVELCQQLTESGRSKVYIILTRLIHLILALPVSTATTERAFSAMKHVKMALHNKMGDDFLEDYLTLYIERDLAKDINVDSIIDEFYVSKSRRAQF